jgi:hypothetical protein
VTVRTLTFRWRLRARWSRPQRTMRLRRRGTRAYARANDARSRALDAKSKYYDAKSKRLSCQISRSCSWVTHHPTGWRQGQLRSWNRESLTYSAHAHPNHRYLPACGADGKISHAVCSTPPGDHHLTPRDQHGISPGPVCGISTGSVRDRYDIGTGSVRDRNWHWDSSRPLALAGRQSPLGKHKVAQIRR